MGREDLHLVSRARVSVGQSLALVLRAARSVGVSKDPPAKQSLIASAEHLEAPHGGRQNEVDAKTESRSL